MSTPTLTPIPKQNLELNFVYRTYTDLSSVTYLVVSNNSGVLFETSEETYTLQNAFNTLNDLFAAVGDVSTNYIPNLSPNYGTYYQQNNMVKGPGDLAVQVTNPTDVLGLSVNAANNSITFTKSVFVGLNNNSDLSGVYNVTLIAYMPFYHVDTTVTNTISVNLKKISISTPIPQVISATSTVGQKGTITFNTSTTSESPYLVIDNCMNAVNNYINGGQWPKVNAQMVPMLLNSSYSIAKGNTSTEIMFNIPPNIFGTWYWSVTLVDGSVSLPPVTIQIQLVPSYKEPVVNFKNQTYTLSKDLSGQVLNLQYNNVDYNVDISNYASTASGMKYDFRMIPQNVSVPVLSDLSGLSLKLNGTGANLFNNSSDVSVTAKLENDIALRLPKVDLSRNGFKNSDVSASYVLNYDASVEYLLSNKNFTLALDWVDRAGNNVSSINATVNIVPQYTSNVVVDNLLNGSYRVSYTQVSLPKPSKFYLEFYDSDGQRVGSQQSYAPDISNNGSMQMDISSVITLYANLNATSFVAYIGDNTNAFLYTFSPSISISVINYPSMIFTVLDGDGQTFEQINVNEVAMLLEGFEPNDPNYPIIDELYSKDISGYYVKDFNVGTDMTAQLILPSWFLNIQNPQVTFTLTDNDQCISALDISCATAKVSSTGTTTKTAVVTDISSFKSMFLDVTFNSTSSATVFRLNYTFSGFLNGQTRTFGSDTIIFYVPQSQEVVPVNAGGYWNYLIIHNDVKLSLDFGTPMGIGAPGAVDASLNNVWRNLATSIKNRYDIRLDRPDFYPQSPSTHQFIYKDITMNAVRVSDKSEQPRAFFSFAKAAKDVKTSVACTGMQSGFSNLSYTFIQLNNFVGYIDIRYNTMKDGVQSAVRNNLRLIVLPRPSLFLTVIDQSANVVPKSTADFNYSVENVQMIGSDKLSIDGNYTVGSTNTNQSELLDASFNSLINSRVRSYLRLTNGQISIAPNSTFFDICQNNMGSVDYGATVSNSIRFLGRDVSINTVLTQNVTANYKNINNSSLTTSNPLTVSILTNNGDNVANNVFANCLKAYKCIKINNIDLAKYVLVDNARSPYILDNSRNLTALWVFVQNVSRSGSVVVTTAAGALTAPSYRGLINVTPVANVFSSDNSNYYYSVSLAAGERRAFYRLASGEWSSFGTI